MDGTHISGLIITALILFIGAALYFGIAKEHKAEQPAIDKAAREKRAYAEASKGMPATTAFTLPGQEVTSVVDIVSAEAAIGINVLKDISTAWRDFAGGRGKAIQEAFREAREICLAELREEAYRVGADAIIGVKLDYNHIARGGGGSMIFLAATGTAVKLAPQARST